MTYSQRYHPLGSLGCKPVSTQFHLMVHSVEGFAMIKELRVLVNSAERVAIPFYQLSGYYLPLEGHSLTFSFELPALAATALLRLDRYRQDVLLKDQAVLYGLEEAGRSLGVVHFSVVAESLQRGVPRRGEEDPGRLERLEGLSDYPRKGRMLKDRHLFTTLLEDLKKGLSWADKDYPRLECPAVACLEPEWKEASKVPLARLKEIFEGMFRSEQNKELRLCWSTVYRHFADERLKLFELGAFFLQLVMHSKMTLTAKAQSIYKFFGQLVPMNEHNVSTLFQALSAQFLTPC